MTRKEHEMTAILVTIGAWLKPIVFGGLLLILTTLFEIRWRKRRPKVLLWSGVGLLTAAMIAVAVIAVLAPGGQRTVEVQRPVLPDVPELVDRDLLRRLRGPWDSDAAPNWPVAETLAQCCEIAYLPPVDARPRFEKLGFTMVEPLVAGSMLGYFVSIKDCDVVVFRGTDDLADWFRNLDTQTVKTPDGRVHRGFLLAYETLASQIATIRRRRGQQEQERHLWLTGHSLGGAMALVGAYELERGGDVTLDGVITFGQPMVANAPLALHLEHQFAGRYVSFVNGSDIVARAPPSLRPVRSLVMFSHGKVLRNVPRRFAVGASSNESPFDTSEIESVENETAELIPLTEEEFEEQKRRLADESAPDDADPDAPMVVQGNTPLIVDHGIELYLDQIRELLYGPPDQQGTGSLP